MVLVTTRFPLIGDKVRTTDPITLDGLDDSSFWSLFKKSAFGNDQYDVPDALENIGRKIAKKLRGNPLAAKTVGALLKGNTDGIHWMKILENETWKSQEGHEGIMPALRMSYEYLPMHLQQCFCYCSLFPKDHYFQEKELVHMWMAQGYIYDEKKRKEDAGIDYLNILVERAFAQLVVWEDWSSPSYVIHDLMHDLAQAVSAEECLAIDNPRHIPRPPPPNLCHLCIHGDQVEEIDNSLDLKNLSSLIIIGGNQKLYNDLKLDQTNNIRLLILESPPLNSPLLKPDNFTSFIHLRYLKLRVDGNFYCVGDNSIAQICTLYHLEVLDLDFRIYLIRLPKDFNNLVNLRHFVPDYLHAGIAAVGKLKYLQELTQFQVREEDGFELDQLAGLKELKGSLCIFNIKIVKCGKDAQSAKLSEKEIDSLTLSWRESWTEVGTFTLSRSQESNPDHVLSEEILEGLQPNNKLRNLCIKYYGGRKSPSWLVNDWLNFLESIELSNCESWEVLPDFCELGFLKKLSLSSLPKIREFTSQFHRCSSGRGFPSLKLMEVVDMDELGTWVWGEKCEVFPVLETLTIRNCPKLKDWSFVPFGGQETTCFPCLSDLTISGCPQLQQKNPIRCIGSTSETYLERLVSSEKSHPIPKWHREPPHLKVELGDLEIPRALDQVLVFKYFRHIKSIKVSRCPNLTCLPWKEILLDCLEKLEIHDCPKLLLSPNEEDDQGKTPSLTSLSQLEICHSPGLTFLDLFPFVALRRLTLRDCKNLACVKGPNSLVSLESLTVKGCPSLLSSWRSASRELDQEFLLTLKNLQIDTVEILSLPACQFLKSLQSLQIEGYQGHNSFTDEQEEAPVLLTALEELIFYGCTHMQSLPRELYRHLSLKKLTICDCPHIDCLPNKGLPRSLKKVHFYNFKYECSSELVCECSKISNLEVTTSSSVTRNGMGKLV